ncbi:cytochrome c oxidase mono-heme subunit/FixO [Solidesulfovibrio fructosivorans JJ]]|uniref:Cytochrome c oxidase mono-heme subunit/FixO n=1 Tax=Solidesulfovibrio fructosivorans JJ] TaxID=596151 RepID=E1K1W9_SOLFR|nr:cytochrome c oxidase mono-heme subunit/FixO [Solidesulfovibrio fructosivorans JJ]]
MSDVLRLVLFAVLFAFLCIQAHELSSPGSRLLARSLFADTATRTMDPRHPEPLKSRALEFRGLTPVPMASGE